MPKVSVKGDEILTSEDIQSKRFERATVGGYRTDDVNAFMISVADEFEKMEKEQADLQNKLIVLADKLSEYRSDEESMRSALLNAQKLGDTILKDSKEKAETMLEGAMQEAESIVATAKKQADAISNEARVSIESETQALSRMQREVAQFKQKILSLYQQQMELIQSIPFDVEKLPSLPDPLISNITRQAKRTEEKSEPEQQKTSPATVVEIDATIKEIDTPEPKEENPFGPLQFGDGIRVTSKD